MTLPRIIFLHLDRTGGTSILNALYHMYLDRGQFFIRTDTPVYGLNDGYAGHFPYQQVHHFLDHLAVTVLRDPVDRELSWLNKCARPEPTSLSQKLRVRTAQRNMDQYIETLVNDGFYASRYTCGRVTLENAFCVLSSLDLVGTTERLGVFYEKLTQLLGVKDPPPLKHENAAPKVFDWTPEQRKRVSERLKDDISIYNYAKTIAV